MTAVFRIVAAVAAAIAAAIPPAQLGPGSPPPIPVDQRGLATGERIPPIDLVDQDGRHRTLESLTGPKGLVLLFVRSADW